MKIYKSFKIRTTLMIAFVSILVGVIIYFVPLFLRYTKDTLVSITTSYTNQITGRVGNAVDNYINYTQSIVDMLEHHSDVRYFMRNKEASVSLQEARSRIINQMKVLLNTRKDIYNIAIITPDRRLIGNYGQLALNPNINMEEQGWYQKTIEAQGKTVISPPHVENIFQNDYRWVITISKAIYHPYTNQLEGIIMVDINYKEISSLCNEVNPGRRGYIFIVDSEGNIIYHPRQQLIYAGLKTEAIKEVLQKDGIFTKRDDSGYEIIYTKVNSEVTDWKIVGVSYEGDLWGNQKDSLIFYMLNMVFILGVGVTVAGYLSYLITNPIQQLGNKMEHTTNEQFTGQRIIIEEPEGGYPDNEIGQLHKSYGSMVREINRLLKDNEKRLEEKRESEMVALQAQINPHFLYNTLDSIIWMAEAQKHEEVIEMTASLARLLRQSISNKKAMVRIEEEVSYVESYLRIQKMRYQEKIDYEIYVDEDVRQQKIIKLVLQPLVENAIYHGLKYKSGKGTIKIIVERKGELIYLIVRDNGIGMSRKQLDSLLEEKKDVTTGGIGAFNVYRRLKLAYGDKYGLSYRSKEGFGTSAFITIPWMEVDLDAER